MAHVMEVYLKLGVCAIICIPLHALLSVILFGRDKKEES